MATASSRRGWLGKSPGPELAPPPARRRGRPGRLGVGLVVLVIVAGLALWQVPEWQVAPARQRLAAQSELSASERLLLENQQFEAENAARGTLALILGATGLLLGLAIAWRRFEGAREARDHERFGRAVEQLASERADGSPRTETRLGGIYALERIAAESEKDYWPIMEVLTAYLRENASRHAVESPPGAAVRPSADVQAIIGVLGRRRSMATTSERRLLDLRETDLRGANLSGVRLEGVTLQAAHLERADATRAMLSRANLREAEMSGAVLTGADLEGAALTRANLEGARLNGANLKGADLSGANLHGADLWEANLKGCNLRDADLRGADLNSADLQEAILWRADLQDATLTGARLKDTHLERANLAGATGLTWEQGEDAFTDENTVLPDYLRVGHSAPAAASFRMPLPPPAGASAARPAASSSSPATPPKPKPRRARQVPQPPAASANVVQLQAPRGASLRPAPTPPPAKPTVKKLARPRKRHQALVAPAR